MILHSLFPYESFPTPGLRSCPPVLSPNSFVISVFTSNLQCSWSLPDFDNCEPGLWFPVFHVDSQLPQNHLLKSSFFFCPLLWNTGSVINQTPIYVCVCFWALENGLDFHHPGEGKQQVEPSNFCNFLCPANQDLPSSFSTSFSPASHSSKSIIPSLSGPLAHQVRGFLP